MIDPSKIEKDGRVAVFHFEDGWIRRAPVDARQIVGAGQGAQEPDLEQFCAFVGRFPLAEREARMVWPASWQMPGWMSDARTLLLSPPAPPAGDSAAKP